MSHVATYRPLKIRDQMHVCMYLAVIELLALGLYSGSYWSAVGQTGLVKIGLMQGCACSFE